MTVLLPLAEQIGHANIPAVVVAGGALLSVPSAALLFARRRPDPPNPDGITVQALAARLAAEKAAEHPEIDVPVPRTDEPCRVTDRAGHVPRTGQPPVLHAPHPRLYLGHPPRPQAPAPPDLVAPQRPGRNAPGERTAGNAAPPRSWPQRDPDAPRPGEHARFERTTASR
ncbi:hypothetical protein [Amycolatopsis sp. NPDC004079]|uniref:hypothetical protein n=1 Tax=Amycolatopsis sp. NPDC004079 TaxID=3154549 RepID=UPI0033A3EAE3